MRRPDAAGEIAERAREVVRQICAAGEVTIIRGAVSPDHIHMIDGHQQLPSFTAEEWQKVA